MADKIARPGRAYRVEMTLVCVASLLLAGCKPYRATGRQSEVSRQPEPPQRAVSAAAPDVAAAERAAQASPRSAGAQLALGNAYLAAGRVVEGLAALQEAARLAPHAESAYHDMARLFQTVNYQDREVAMLRRLVDLRTQDLTVYLRLAEIYLQLGWTDNAEPILKRALALAPNEPAPNAQMARCLFERGKTLDAIQLLLRVHRLHTDDVETTDLLGQYLLAADRGAEAERLLRDALARQPGEPKLEPLLANCLLRRGMAERLPEVIRLIRDLLRRQPPRAEYYCWLGRAYERLQRPADAMVAYQHALSLDPAFENTTLALGRLYLRQGRKAEASRLIGYYTQIKRNSSEYNQARERIRLNPKDAGAHYQVARWDLRVRAYAAAAMEFERALQLRPADPLAREGLRQSLLAAGRRTEAKAVLASTARSSATP